MQALARRRLGDLTRPRSRPEAPLTDPLPAAGAPPAIQGRRGRLSDDLAARLPATLRDGRVAVSRAAASGLAVLAVVALVLAGSYAWRARSVEAVLPADPGASSGSKAASASAGSTPLVSTSASPASPTGVVVIDVAGKVRQPGVVRLPLGSRVVDAIAAAGGVRGDVDLTTLNLARVLADGEQVLVGVAGGLPTAGGPTTASAGPEGVIDLNSATLEQLDTLPGVGPVLAQRILDWRTAHGRFSTIDELREVSGIGDARFADLSTRVRV